MNVQLILESDWISLEKYDEESGEAEFKILDATQKEDELYFINVFLDYYKNKKHSKKIKINVKEYKYEDKKDFYELASYYKYLIEIEKIDIIAALRILLRKENIYNGINIRANYFIYRYFQKVEELPYSRQAKDKILSIFNYVLNYRYKPGTVYIPINIVIYSNDKDSVNNIKYILGEFMWFFCYLPEDTKYYDEFMNNIILDKFSIKNLYLTKDNNGVSKKRGILLIHNFSNILFTNSLDQNLILNILTDEMENNNNNLCTIIYGSKDELMPILSKHPKLGKLLINLELEIDELDIEKIYEILVNKLEINEKVTEEVKEKLYKYISSTYSQSENRDMEYIKKIYNKIILNKNNRFDINKENILSVEDIPEVYNTRGIPEILKELNDLVGLSEIKKQVNDLIYLLKFNQKANIDISKFNLHMIFTGNPGTGKTTVARLISDVLYKLGYIKQNKLVEVSSKDLIAEYVGQTAGKTFSVLKSAFGGVLFIDEAYSLIGEGAKFGDEAISTILKVMEDNRDKLIIIFAGYKEEMKRFEMANVGLSSRIGYKIDFKDYTLDELMSIFLQLLEKNKLTISEEASDKVKEIIKESSKIENFGNARYINNLFQKILINHAKNVDEKNEENMYIISSEDIDDSWIVTDNKRKIGF